MNEFSGPLCCCSAIHTTRLNRPSEPSTVAGACMPTPMDGAVRIVASWHQWWSQPLFEVDLSRALESWHKWWWQPVFEVMRTNSGGAVQAIKAAGGDLPGFAKPLLGIMSTGGIRFLRRVLKPAAVVAQAAPVQVPAVAPPIWRVVWFVLTNLPLALPPVVNLLNLANNRHFREREERENSFERSELVDSNEHSQQPAEVMNSSEPALEQSPEHSDDGIQAPMVSALDTPFALCVHRFVDLITCWIPWMIGALVSMLLVWRIILRRSNLPAAWKMIESSAPQEPAASPADVKANSPVTESQTRQSPSGANLADPKRLAFGECLVALQVARTFGHIRLRRGLNTWRDLTATRARAYSLLQWAALHATMVSATRRCAGLSVSECWCQWRRCSSWDRHCKQAVTVFRCSRGLQRGWVTWVDAAAQGAHKLSCLQIAVSEWMGSRRRAAWTIWLGFVTQRATVMRVANSLRSPKMLQAINCWVAHAAEMGETKRLARKVLMSLRARRIRHAVNAWQEYAQLNREHKVYVARAQASLSLWLGSSRLRTAWMSWCKVVSEHISVRESAYRFIMHDLLAAWWAWCDMVAEKVMLMSMVQRFRCPFLLHGLRSWAANVAEAREWRWFIDGAITSMQMRSAQCALTSWRECIASRRACMERMMKPAASLLHARERKALHTWASAAKTQIAHRVVQHRLVMRLQKLGLARGWNTWKCYVRSLHEAVRVLQSTVQVFSERQQGLRTRAAWLSWIDCYHQAAEVRRCLYAAAATWMGSATRAAWLTWREAVSDWKLLLEAVITLSHPSLRCALRMWAMSSEGRRELQRKARYALARVCRLSLRRGFSTWSATSEELATRQRLLAYVIMLRNHAKAVNALSSSWLIWNRYIQMHADSMECIRAAARFFIHGHLGTCFASWQSHSSHVSALLERMSHVLARLTAAQLSRSWNTWARAALTAHERERCLRAAVSEWKGSRRRAAWLAWSEYQQTHSAMMQRLRAASRFFIHGHLALGFAAWRDGTCQVGARLERMSHVLARLKAAQLSRSWNTWARAALTAHERERCLRAAVSEWKGSRRRAAWQQWCSFTQAAHLLVRAVFLLCNPRLSRALRRWSNAAQQVLKYHTMLVGTIQSWQARTVRYGFNSWRAKQHHLACLATLITSICCHSLRKVI